MSLGRSSLEGQAAPTSQVEVASPGLGLGAEMADPDDACRAALHLSGEEDVSAESELQLFVCRLCLRPKFCLGVDCLTLYASCTTYASCALYAMCFTLSELRWGLALHLR